MVNQRQLLRRNDGFGTYSPDNPDPGMDGSWGPAASAHMTDILRRGGLIPGTGHAPGQSPAELIAANSESSGGFVPTTTIPPGPGTGPPSLGGMHDTIVPTTTVSGEYTPGTPGGPGFVMPPDGTTDFTGQMGTTVPANAGADPGGQFSGFWGQMPTDAALGLVNDPNQFYRQWALSQGMDLNTGNYAMGQQYAPNMPIEFLMTPGAQDGQYTQDGQLQYYQDNIVDGQTPGTGYYTAQQFAEQAFTKDSAMNNYIFGAQEDANGVIQAVSPEQQFSNFLSAMEMVLAPSMSDEMFGILASRYAQAFQQYQDMAMRGEATMPLEDWLLQFGLGG